MGSECTSLELHRLRDALESLQNARQLMIIHVPHLYPESFTCSELQWLATDSPCDADFDLPAHKNTFNNLCSTFKVYFNAQAPSTPWICVAPVHANIQVPRGRTLTGTGFLVLSTQETATTPYSQSRSTHVSNFAQPPHHHVDPAPSGAPFKPLHIQRAWTFPDSGLMADAGMRSKWPPKGATGTSSYSSSSASIMRRNRTIISSTPNPHGRDAADATRAPEEGLVLPQEHSTLPWMSCSRPLTKFPQGRCCQCGRWTVEEDVED